MKLLRLSLIGKYKGLKDQVFDFSNSSGQILAFIGLNGSGKSQLLELICEAFAICERSSRQEFKVKTGLGRNEVKLEYVIDLDTSLNQLDHIRVTIKQSGSIFYEKLTGDNWVEYISEESEILPRYVVGYSSGLNENLQRSFMKNAVQYYDVIKVRSRYRTLRSQVKDVKGVEDLNRKYSANHPGIFKAKRLDWSQSEVTFDSDITTLDQTVDFGADLIEKDTRAPNLIYLDYDCNALLMASLAILPKKELDDIFPDIEYKYPSLIKIHYKLNTKLIEDGAINDIKRLIELVGSDNFEGLGNTSSEEQYNIFPLDYLEGVIHLNVGSELLRKNLNELYLGNPLTLFNRLYKLQLLGVRLWLAADKKKLKNDSFLGNVKKPLKAHLPLSVTELILSNREGGNIEFNDLSDGEAQLFQILGAARLFRDENTLFVLDEPETHLNPSWRTHFHECLNQVLSTKPKEQANTQVLLSTHSPFMISSLPK
ncbi:MAG: AAA family ATPase, partial [Colwellia sp.]